MKTTMKETSNNNVSLVGTVASKVEFSHELYGRKFYVFQLEVERLSWQTDIIPIIIPEEYRILPQIKEGKKIYVEGNYRSYNKEENDKKRLVLSVFPSRIEPVDEEKYWNMNSIALQGFICKPVVYRKTPLGREVADMMIAVNRLYGKSDYIPCIAWGRNARWASGFELGNELKIWGRIQSREYVKKLSDEESEKRTAYEVSVSKLELV